MPPKKPAQPAANKKTQEKKKEKIIEDKTFGLKNKKGGKQQKFIKNVEHQVKSGGPPRTKKVAAGVDPKSVLCAFFKQGQCTKGDKCKFSHDLTMERKCEKRSLYVDKRDDELEKDTMDGWDEKKLEEVVAHKHGESEKKKVKTNIVCKHFLDAIESNKYGWFWACPSGGEELIENERAALGANVTRITLETFLAWKKRKRLEKIEKAREQMEKKKADFKAGKSLTVSGREDDFVDVQDIDLSRFVPQEVDHTVGITVASTDRFSSRSKARPTDPDSEELLNGACGGEDTNGLSEEEEEEEVEEVPVDENLFHRRRSGGTGRGTERTESGGLRHN
ncbi:hypothetical protein JOQ06_028195, partial [Pogonophryne albipinna]